MGYKRRSVGAPLIIPLLVFSLVWAGCSKNAEQEIEKDTYVFQDIHFFINEADGDGIKILEYDESRGAIHNATSSEAKCSMGSPYKKSDSSTFFHETFTLRSLVVQPTKEISLPHDIRNGELVIGKQQGEYLLNGTQVFPHSEQPEDPNIITIPAYTKFDIQDHYEHRQIKTSYTALFVGQKTGTVMEVSGKWKGIFITNTGNSIKFEDIKPH